MSMSETLTLHRRLPTRLSACVVASEAELAHLKGQFSEEFQQLFTGIASAAHAPLPDLPIGPTNVLVIEVNPALPGTMGRIEQARSRYPDLPIIAAVEHLDLSKVRTLMRLGIKDVVALPFNADELLPAVKNIKSERPGIGCGNGNNGRPRPGFGPNQPPRGQAAPGTQPAPGAPPGEKR